jgi:dCMP deaminase
MILSNDWQQFYIGMADYVATKSKDGSTKVGAVLVRPDKTVAGIGFNGFPRRIKDHTHMLEAKTDKGKALKYMRTVHAECNCLNNTRDFDLTGYHLFVNGYPCADCALRICSTGIQYIYYKANADLETRWAESMLKSATLLYEAKLTVVRVEHGN